MSEDIKVTPHGTIVARGQHGEVWVYPDHDDGIWCVGADEDGAHLTRDQLLAFCRRVLREVDPDPVPTVDEVMAAWGVDDLQIRVVPRAHFLPSRVVIRSDEVLGREDDLSLAGVDVQTTRTRYADVIGAGADHADALRNALANAAGPWGDLP